MQTDNKLNFDSFQLIINIIFDAINPEVLGSQLTHLLVTTMGIKGASVFIVNPRKDELEILSAEGLSLEYVNKGPILVDKSIKLESNLKPVIIADTNASEKLQYPDKAKEEGVRSIISLPINLKGKIIGALRVYDAEPWEISQQDLSYLEVITCYLAMALRYFRLAAAIQTTKDTFNNIHSIWL